MLSFFGQLSVEAQNRCRTTSFHQQQIASNPDYLQEYLQSKKVQKKLVDNWNSNKAVACPIGSEVIIPVAVHYDAVVPASDQACLIALAEQQVDILNDDYSGNNASGCSTGSNACIKFVLANNNHPASSDLVAGDLAVTFNAFACPPYINSSVGCPGPLGCPEPCNLSAWNGYLNLMVEFNTGFLGIAPLNGNPFGINSVVVDACAFGSIDPEGFIGGCNSAGPQSCGETFYDRGATATHEVGHYFGMEHTFCTDAQGLNGSNDCIEDIGDCDGFTDTPLQAYSNYGCVGGSSFSCPEPINNPCGDTAIFNNFMDYLNDACMNSFTEQQTNFVNTNASNETYGTNKFAIFDSLTTNVYLQGAYTNSPDNLMRDDLRALGLIPLTEPYTDLSGFEHVNGGGEQTSQAVLQITGTNAIVDWVLIEIQDASNNVISTRSALLQRDGDVVEVDGVSPIIIQVLEDYNVRIRHRNHLGVITDVIGSGDNNMNFNNGANYPENALIEMAFGKKAMWGGAPYADGMVSFQGPGSGVNAVFFKVLSAPENTFALPSYIYSNVYDETDYNMDGIVTYQGSNNSEVNFLFFTILQHPENTSVLTNYLIFEQIP